MSMIAVLLVWILWISMILMMIALVMMKISLISMSTFVECMFAWTHQIEKIDVSAENLNFLSRTCELCNEHGHFSTQCKLFHDRIVSKNCDDLISLAHHNELSLLLGYEEMKRITKVIPEFALDRVLNFDLEEIYMYCAVNCIENPYIANYIKKGKKI